MAAAWNFIAARNVSIYELWRRCHVERTFISQCFFSASFARQINSKKHKRHILVRKAEKNRNEKVVWRSVARCDRTVRKFITIHISRLCSRHQHLYLDICPRINFVTVSYRNVLCMCVWPLSRENYMFSGLCGEYLNINYTHRTTHTHTHTWSAWYFRQGTHNKLFVPTHVDFDSNYDWI